uniref:FAR1 domain-containing protein n=1 Tax=Lotus japonicus TaxID=34305 RepID=I3S3C6_LOTJA|nr:unknown [Lotus japonicus]
MATFGEEGCVNLSDDVNDLVNNEEENQHEKDSKFDSEGECYKKINELTADDIWGLEFSTEEEGCLFYHKYAQYRGFASRKDDVYKDNDGNIVTRQLVCNKAGRRHEKHFKNNDRVKQPKAITFTVFL